MTRLLCALCGKPLSAVDYIGRESRAVRQHVGWHWDCYESDAAASAKLELMVKDVAGRGPGRIGGIEGWEQADGEFELPRTTAWALDCVRQERLRQDQLKAQGRFLLTCADLEMTHPERLAVLGEEFGEVCHEVNEPIGGKVPLDRAALRKELVQVAAVCVAWIEALDKEVP